MSSSYYFENLLTKYTDCWYKTSSRAPDQLFVKGHVQNDKNLLALKKEVINLLNQDTQLSGFKKSNAIKLIKEKTTMFMINTLEIDPWALELLDQEDYYAVTEEFLTRAKNLFKDLSIDDIFQALRNVWVIVALQVYMNVEVKLTNAVFAYSMLYPLTDNYLDDSTIPINNKRNFNDRFHKKIQSNLNETINEKEKRIFSMIDLIENDFPRNEYPDVFKSLLAILDGQKKSLEQHNLTHLYDKDLLKYTFYKGGTSVLADAYLIKGTLSNKEAEFAYGYGVILQLADDLQDITEDINNTQYTLFNTQACYSKLDCFYSKYENFIVTFNNAYLQSESKNIIALSQLLKKSIELLLFSGVCKNKKHFSRNYFADFLDSSIFSPRIFNKYNKKITDKIKL